jgi:hypothetical protein
MTPDANSNNNTLIAELVSYTRPQTFRYDDGGAETNRSWTGDFSGFAVEFQIPDAVSLDTASIHINSVTITGPLYVWVLPDNGLGRPDPDNILAGDTVDVTISGWVNVDFTAANLSFAPDAKFFIVGVHALQSTFTFSMDQTAPLCNRGWEFTSGYAPDRDRSISDIMFKVYCSTPGPGMISGIVYGDDGVTPLPGAVITTYDDLNAVVGIDTSGVAGDYLISLPGGNYHELFQKSGFRDTTVQDILVSFEQTTILNVVMQVSSGCAYTIGDINNNGAANGIDVVYGVNYFKGSSAPPIDCGSPVGPCPQASPFYAAGDVNGNCAFNGIDVTFFVNYLKGVVPALLICPTCPPAGR